MEDDILTRKVIGCAIEVHKILGPGLLESIYESALCRELDLCGLRYERQFPINVEYKGEVISNDLRLDLLVANQLVVELKSVEALMPVHHKQVLSYMRLTKMRKGLLINFNESVLVKGIKRISDDNYYDI